MSCAETLLVNYWYAHPVGHALEGMRYALGYKAANPELRVSLLLNERPRSSLPTSVRSSRRCSRSPSLGSKRSTATR
jgi:hypothetical protein